MLQMALLASIEFNDPIGSHYRTTDNPQTNVKLSIGCHLSCAWCCKRRNYGLADIACIALK